MLRLLFFSSPGSTPAWTLLVVLLTSAFLPGAAAAQLRQHEIELGAEFGRLAERNDDGLLLYGQYGRVLYPTLALDVRLAYLNATDLHHIDPIEWNERTHIMADVGLKVTPVEWGRTAFSMGFGPSLRWRKERLPSLVILIGSPDPAEAEGFEIYYEDRQAVDVGYYATLAYEIRVYRQARLGVRAGTLGYRAGTSVARLGVHVGWHL